MRRQDGFTLIELLVVVLILGMLAALAIPSFIGQRSRANDAEAQQTALSLRKALESYRTDTDDYSGATVANLVAQDASLIDAQSEGRLSVTATDLEFSLGVRARQTGTVFRFERAAGLTQRTCDQPGKGGCKATSNPAVGTWGGG
jgi:type IV pilus assembly protein PilA